MRYLFHSLFFYLLLLSLTSCNHQRYRRSLEDSIGTHFFVDTVHLTHPRVVEHCGRYYVMEESYLQNVDTLNITKDRNCIQLPFEITDQFLAWYAYVCTRRSIFANDKIVRKVYNDVLYYHSVDNETMIEYSTRTKNHDVYTFAYEPKYFYLILAVKKDSLIGFVPHPGKPEGWLDEGDDAYPVGFSNDYCLELLPVYSKADAKSLIKKYKEEHSVSSKPE